MDALKNTTKSDWIFALFMLAFMVGMVTITAWMVAAGIVGMVGSAIVGIWTAEPSV